MPNVLFIAFSGMLVQYGLGNLCNNYVTTLPYAP